MISLSRTKYKQKRSSPSKESPLPPTRFATALANLFLAFSSGWALRMTGGFRPQQLSTVTFTLLLVHSLLGVVRFGNPQYGEALRSLYENTSFLCIVIALPCFAGQLALIYSVSYNYYTVPLILLSFFVVLWHYVRRIFTSVHSNGGEARWAKSKHVSVVVILSLCFVLAVSYKNVNYYGIAAAVAYAHNFLCIGPTGTAFNLPAVDLFLYELAFFNFFAVKALLD